MLRPMTFFERYVRHPLEALPVALVWGLFRLLPVDWASALGGWIGRTVGPRIAASERARGNIERAFPGIGDDAAEKIIADMWENLGRTVGEFPHLGTFTFGEDDNARVRVDGLEHMLEFRDDGEPGFFLSAHLANWELGPMAAHVHGVPSRFVYREANNPYVQKLYLAGREQYRDRMIPKGREGAKEMLRALRNGEHIGVLMDQKMNDGIAVRFFGRDAMTATALGDLAVRTKCPVLPARVIREKGARFRVEISPLIHAGDTGNAEADARAFTLRANQIIEQWVREKPGQWLWLHNRWPGDS